MTKLEKTNNNKYAIIVSDETLIKYINIKEKKKIC